jgi:hypothetical protein
MSDLPEELQPLMDELAMERELPPNVVSDIGEAIRTSSSLRERMVLAVLEQELRHVDIAPKGSHTGGYFDASSGTLYLAPEIFAGDDARARIDLVTDHMGHEIAHGLLADERAQAIRNLALGVRRTLVDAQDHPHVDLTSQVGSYLAFTRWDEAVAEIGGINAVSSRVVDGLGGKVSQAAILGRAQSSTTCIEQEGNAFRLADGITLSPEGKIDATTLAADGRRVQSPNIDAVGVCHYDNSRPLLGELGKSSYRNYYGAAAIGIVADEVEAFRASHGLAPNVRLDLAGLGLDAEQVRAAGLDLGGEGGHSASSIPVMARWR